MEASWGSNLRGSGKWPRWDFNPHLPESGTRGICGLASWRERKGLTASLWRKRPNWVWPTNAAGHTHLDSYNPDCLREPVLEVLGWSQDRGMSDSHVSCSQGSFWQKACSSKVWVTGDEDWSALLHPWIRAHRRGHLSVLVLYDWGGMERKGSKTVGSQTQVMTQSPRKKEESGNPGTMRCG